MGNETTKIEIKNRCSIQIETNEIIEIIDDDDDDETDSNPTGKLNYYCNIDPNEVTTWKLCELLNETNVTPNINTYNVKLLCNGKIYSNITKNLLAPQHSIYVNNEKFIINRIIARRDPDRLPYKMDSKDRTYLYQNMDDGFYAGITLQEATIKNQRYQLVFFDDGHVQYVLTELIRRICDDIDWNDVDDDVEKFYKYYQKVVSIESTSKKRCAFSTDFIYFQKDHIKIELNGNWQWAVVEEIVDKLYRVRFSDINRFEWIYRNSPRIDAIWRHLHTEKNFREFFPLEESPTTVIDTDEHDINHEKRISSNEIIALKSTFPKGKTYALHKCDMKCRTNGDGKSEFYKLNALLKPFAAGWQRIRYDGHILYFSPCGVRLAGLAEIYDFLKKINSNLEIDCFSFEIGISCDRIHKSNQPILIEDISDGLEDLPIQVVGDPADGLPEKFEYVKSIHLTSGVPQFLLNPYREVCCDCNDDCRDKTKCACWQFNMKRYTKETKRSSDELFGYVFKRLYDQISTGIFECHSGCHCSKKCFNRVAQQPTTHLIEVFENKNCGWGLRCLNDIPKGSFVSTYLGDIFSDSNLDNRAAKTGDVYFYALNPSHISSASKKRRLAKGITSLNYFPLKLSEANQSKKTENFVIDAKIRGNLSRYYNHSCDPNLVMQSVYIDTHDVRFPRLAFFALRNIKAGDELTIDYGYEEGSIDGRIFYCYCGAESCRRRLL